MPKPKGPDIVARRHVEWREHQVNWQWLLDSYEGGARYRDAVYGRDRRGLPVRNLHRHKREYPDPQDFPSANLGFSGALAPSSGLPADLAYGPFAGMLGADPAATGQDDDYELRRSRTPVPEWVSCVVECHLAKVYDQEIKREGPPALSDEVNGFWTNVDGRGTPVDDWMSDTSGPLLMVLGQLDVLFDHPPRPKGETITTQGDVQRLGLQKCVATYILPENVIWWRLDSAGNYIECLIKEYEDPSEWTSLPTTDQPEETITWAKARVRFRHWTSKDSTLYDYDGNQLEPPFPHSYGRVPLRRSIDVRRQRSPHIGKSRYEVIAGLQREFYNRDSELILSDTLQAHPLLSGPQDFCTGDDELSIGPGYVLPKKKSSGANGDSYEGWEYVSPAKDPAESIRKNKHDIIDEKDQAAHLTKPAGAHGSTGHTVAQSGVSKQLDHASGNKLLTRIAKTLARAEREWAEYALMVCLDRPPTVEELAQIQIIYPSRFDLFSVDELAAGIAEFQGAVSLAGEAPKVEKLLLQALIRQLLLGLEDGEYAELDEEIDLILEAKAKAKEAASEAGLAAAMANLTGQGRGDSSDALSAVGDREAGGEMDPSGQSGATAVTNTLASAF